MGLATISRCRSLTVLENLGKSWKILANNGKSWKILQPYALNCHFSRLQSDSKCWQSWHKRTLRLYWPNILGNGSQQTSLCLPCCNALFS